MNTILKVFPKISYLTTIVLITIAGNLALAAVDISTLGTSEPPFLSQGAKSNLLLLLDNSGSMLDLAYEAGECTDNSFVSSDKYAGLFDYSKWYYWKKASDDTFYFEEVTYTKDEDGNNVTEDEDGNKVFGSPITFSPTPATKYESDNIVVKVIEAIDSSGEIVINERGNTIQDGITAFAASGNLLNWAAASKFDIQKEILTGGKYDNTDKFLISEGRGCSGRPYIKEVPIYLNSNLPTQKSRTITLSIRGYDEDSTIPVDSLTRIAILGITEFGFISDQGYSNYADCLEAINIWSTPPDGNFIPGQASGSITACMDYKEFKNNNYDTSNPAYNHGVSECLTLKKDPTINTYTEFLNAKKITFTENIGSCQDIFDPPEAVDPTTIDPDRNGYVCSGDFDEYNFYLVGEGGNYDPDTSTPGEYGYIGRCWDYENASWIGGYVGQGEVPDVLDKCILDAMWDFCNGLRISEVIDPSNPISTGTTGDSWGMIATLIDAGVVSYFDNPNPLLQMPVKIKHLQTPTGIIQDVAKDMRLGVMAFNDNGALTECNEDALSQDKTIIKHCGEKDANGDFINYDGANVMTPIKDGDAAHIVATTAAINDMEATSWTPLAEAVFNALGYYGQVPARQLNDTDFNISEMDDPVQNWCQENYLLIITEGESTADVNKEVTDFVTLDMPNFAGDTFNDTDTDKRCLSLDGTSNLYGSTYLDDLTDFGQNALASDLFTTPQLESDQGEMLDKQNITTYIVATSPPDCDPSDPKCDQENECSPTNLMTHAAENGGSELIDGRTPDELRSKLLALFNELRKRASAGSSASVVSSSRGGEGAVYQAIFWPEISTTGTVEVEGEYQEVESTVQWMGDVRALFIDGSGFLFEDTDHNRQFYTEDTNGDGYLTGDEDIDEDGVMDGDKRIIVFYDADPNSGIPRSKACYNISLYGPEKICDNWTELEDVNFLWSASERLSDNEVITGEQRGDGPGEYISATPKRNIYTWNDLNYDGIVNHESEWLDFASTTDWLALPVDTTRRSGVATDFDVTSVTGNDTERLNKINDIVEWIRGNDRNNAADFDGDGKDDSDGDGKDDNPPLRSRAKFVGDVFPDIATDSITLRLGDVIHSTPMAVTSPAENFHQLYNDFSYAKFTARHQARRHMIYFGANDGMLHAVNGGFFNGDKKQFCLSPNVDGNGDCDDLVGSFPKLGSELWAYVPYNMLPHLKSLTKADYIHKYYVDLRPRIFDVQIFEPEVACATSSFANERCIHPEGWGTILVGGMRLGGSPINANEIDGASIDDIRQFISSYFILDITDPEKPPVLLGELTNYRTSGGETFEDTNANGGDGVWFPGEEFVDKPNGVYDVVETFVDKKINGIWDDGEDFFEENGEYDLGEDFTDSNANGVYDDGELFDDIDNDGIRDDSEDYLDENDNGVYDAPEEFVDNIDGAYNPWEAFVDRNGDGSYNGPEDFTDSNNNDEYDPGEAFTDNLLNGKFDIGEPFDDSNNNGVYDLGEDFTDNNLNMQYDGPETFTDVGNGKYDQGEDFTDSTSGDYANGVYDPPEPFNDLNGNGTLDSWSPSSPIDLDIDGTIDNYADLGHSTNISTMIVMKKDNAAPNSTDNQWYLALGSGPHGADAMKGVSDQNAKMAILPLDWLAIPENEKVAPKALRIPAAAPKDDPAGLTFTLDDASEGFISDPVTLDIDINPSRTDYMADAVYFGTTEGHFVEADGISHWAGGGKFYRLRTRDTVYYRYPGQPQGITKPEDWEMTVLLDTGRPISAAPSLGYDGYNFWIYGGTGRFWDPADKTDDSQHAYYGIKETMIPTDDGLGFELTYKTVPPYLPGVSPIIFENPGDKGLVKVDEILVEENALVTEALLSCRGDISNLCLPDGIHEDDDGKSYLSDLEEYIAGQGDATDPGSNSADGWYKEFFPYNNRERNLGQATILGGLVVFTTYKPYSDPCRAEGIGELYGVYYKTGTAWHKNIFGDFGVINSIVQDKMVPGLGQGLAETPNLFVGAGKDGKVRAYVQTSTGEVKGIELDNLPIQNYYSGQSRWKTCRGQ